MPIYRTKEQYLRSAVESILSQSFGDYEFLILDDSPCDASLREVVQSYRDARIKYVAVSGHWESQEAITVCWNLPAVIMWR